MANDFADAVLVRVLQGDRDAIGFVTDLVAVCDVWDDLIDRDVNVAAEDIHQAFFRALHLIPSNVFYRRHFEMLHPLVVAGIFSWWASNALERQPLRRARQIAFVARSQIAEVITISAAIIGGAAWARECGPDIKLLIHCDSMESYFKELESKHGMDEQPGA